MLTSVVVIRILVNVALNVNAQQYRDCASDLSDINSYVGSVGSLVNSWQPSDGYGAALKIHATEQKVEDLIVEATSACDLGGQISSSQADTILGALNSLVPNIESALRAVVQKKPAFDSVPLVTRLVTTDVQNLFVKTHSLENNLLAAVPDSRKQEATEDINRINYAFSQAYRAYGLY